LDTVLNIYEPKKKDGYQKSAISAKKRKPKKNYISDLGCENNGKKGFFPKIRNTSVFSYIAKKKNCCDNVS